MRFWTIVGLSLIVTGCAVAPAPLTTAERDTVFSDALFKRPSQRISAEDVFALSPEMQEYLRNDVARVVRTKGSQHGLFDALYDKGLLKLEYDAAMTRNASQAFAARAGNCLSLVIMTAAFAKEMGMPVRYQNVFVDETWSRNGEFYLSIGHVNLSLGHRLVEYGPTESAMTIDFLPPANIKGLRTWVIDEATIVAMYMNNRAVEALTVGNVDDAYWYAREAITQDRRFLTAFNTLGVVYQKHGNLPQSQRAFEYVLEREPGNTRSMSNLAAVLFASGNTVAAEALTRKLAQIEPNPPLPISSAASRRWRRATTSSRSRCSRRKSIAPRTTTSSSSGWHSRISVLATPRMRARILRSRRRTARRATTATSMPRNLRI